MSVMFKDVYSVQKCSCGTSCQLIVAMQMQCDCVLCFPIPNPLAPASRHRGHGSALGLLRRMPASPLIGPVVEAAPNFTLTSVWQ